MANNQYPRRRRESKRVPLWNNQQAVQQQNRQSTQAGRGPSHLRPRRSRTNEGGEGQ